MRIESVNSRKEALKECKGIIYNFKEFKEINCGNQYGICEILDTTQMKPQNLFIFYYLVKLVVIKIIHDKF